MDRQGDLNVSPILKQAMVLILLLPALAQPVFANGTTSTDSKNLEAPKQAPVQLGWDRVGDRERNWV